MKHDRSLALRDPSEIPEALRGTRQGLFFLLSPDAGPRAEPDAHQEKVSRPAPPVSAQPAARDYSILLTRDDFHFNF
jgi:hypothetical protein